MKVFRLTCCRLGRLLLVLALFSTALVRNAVGDALILHQHGLRRAHLHILGYGDLRSNAAWSSQFGHRSRSEPALPSASQGVRILAIIATGSVFISSARGAGSEGIALVPSQNPLVLSIAEPQRLPGVDSLSIFCTACFGRTASAVILRRNHTLLI